MPRILFARHQFLHDQYIVNKLECYSGRCTCVELWRSPRKYSTNFHARYINLCGSCIIFPRFYCGWLKLRSIHFHTVGLYIKYHTHNMFVESKWDGLQAGVFFSSKFSYPYFTNRREKKDRKEKETYQRRKISTHKNISVSFNSMLLSLYSNSHKSFITVKNDTKKHANHHEIFDH